MDKSDCCLEWMLLGIRVLVGALLIMYGLKSVIAQVSTPTPFEGSHWPGFATLFPIIVPIVEIISGFLLVMGFVIELGAFLVVPVLFSSLILILLKYSPASDPSHIKYLLNIAALSTAVGICGPGKWALWDPGKSLRQNLLNKN